MITKAKLNQIMLLSEILNDVLMHNIDTDYTNPFIEDDYRSLLENFFESSKSVLIIKISKTRYLTNLKYYKRFKEYFGLGLVDPKGDIAYFIESTYVDFSSVPLQLLEIEKQDGLEFFNWLYISKGRLLYE